MFAGAFIVRNVGMLQAQNLINFQLREDLLDQLILVKTWSTAVWSKCV